MARTLAFLYGAISYLIFFVTFLYAIGFVGNIIVPKSIDTGPSAATFTRGLILNVILMSIFALQHSIMARPGFKRWWTRFVPEPVERSTYVLLASLALILLFWQWRSMPDVIWRVTDPSVATALIGLSLFGWLHVLLSTIMLNHLDLFVLHQVAVNLAGTKLPEQPFK